MLAFIEAETWGDWALKAFLYGLIIGQPLLLLWIALGLSFDWPIGAALLLGSAAVGVLHEVYCQRTNPKPGSIQSED